MSLLTLPEPDNWPSGDRRARRIVAGALVFVTIGAGFAVRDVLRGALIAALVDAGIASTFGLFLIALYVVAHGGWTLRADADSTGTRLRPPLAANVLMLGGIAAAMLTGIVVVVFTLTGDLQMFSSPRGKYGAMALMAVASATAAYGLVSAWRRGGVGYVKLTPTGIDIADILRTKTLAWEDITAIGDHSEAKKTRKAIVLTLSDGSESVIDGADFYVPNGVGLYWMVRHYLTDVDSRAELVDGHAVERLSQGVFDVE